MVVSVEHTDIIDIDCFGHSSLRLGCDWDTTSSCMSISRRWAKGGNIAFGTWKQELVGLRGFLGHMPAAAAGFASDSSM